MFTNVQKTILWLHVAVAMPLLMANFPFWIGADRKMMVGLIV
jgi:hypothetical protein